MPGTIVVGIDGSDTAKLAARWGAKEAGLRGARLELVGVVEAATSSGGFGFPADQEDVLGRLSKAAEEHLTEVASSLDDEGSGLDIATTVIDGHAAKVLIDKSNDADLVVIGSRGHGGFRGMLLGSVSLQVVHHSQCPVVVVRHLNE